MLQAKVQNMSNYRYPGGPIFNPFGFGMGVGAGDFKTLKEKEIKNGDVFFFLTIAIKDKSVHGVDKIPSVGEEHCPC